MKTLKILFLLLLMIPSIASADYTFYVENSDMVDSYFNIFNAIAMLFQSDSYIDLLRLVFLFGGFFVFIGGILQGFGKDGKGALSGYATYTITGFAFLSIVFSSPTTLWIESETLPSYCSASSTTTGVAVGNIPNVLAYTFATINSVGRGMTRLAETAFTVPTSAGNTSMKDSGGYLGSLKQAITLLTSETNPVMLKGPNPVNIDGGFKSFFSECIMVPFSSNPEGKPIIAEILGSGDLFLYLDNMYATNTRTVGGTLVGDFLINSFGETWTCKGMFDNVLKPGLQSYGSQAGCAIGAAGGAMQLITGIKGAPTSKFEEIAQNAALLNSLEGVNKDLGVSVSGSAYASGKTKADFIQSSYASGSYFAEILPYLQMTLRAILYAFFPFVFIVVMLPGGMKVITQYMQTLLWIELWSPTAAIVNMFVLKKAENDMGGKYISDQGLTLINSMQMLESATTISAIGAYLYASVPALTWLILKGSGDMLGNVAGAMGAKMATNIQTDSINKDAGSQAHLKAANEERSARGEKAFSMAEMQHFNSVNDESKKGAVSGYESTVDSATLKDIAKKQSMIGVKQRLLESQAGIDIKKSTDISAQQGAGGIIKEGSNQNNQGSAYNANQVAAGVLQAHGDTKNAGIVDNKMGWNDKNKMLADTALIASADAGDLNKKVDFVSKSMTAIGLDPKNKEDQKTFASKYGEITGRSDMADLMKKDEFQKGLALHQKEKDLDKSSYKGAKTDAVEDVGSNVKKEATHSESGGDAPFINKMEGTGTLAAINLSADDKTGAGLKSYYHGVDAAALPKSQKDIFNEVMGNTNTGVKIDQFGGGAGASGSKVGNITGTMDTGDLKGKEQFIKDQGGHDGAINSLEDSTRFSLDQESKRVQTLKKGYDGDVQKAANKSGEVAGGKEAENIEKYFAEIKAAKVAIPKKINDGLDRITEANEKIVKAQHPQWSDAKIHAEATSMTTKQAFKNGVGTEEQVVKELAAHKQEIDDRYRQKGIDQAHMNKGEKEAYSFVQKLEDDKASFSQNEKEARASGNTALANTFKAGRILTEQRLKMANTGDFKKAKKKIAFYQHENMNKNQLEKIKEQKALVQRMTSEHLIGKNDKGQVVIASQMKNLNSKSPVKVSQQIGSMQKQTKFTSVDGSQVDASIDMNKNMATDSSKINLGDSVTFNGGKDALSYMHGKGVDTNTLNSAATVMRIGNDALQVVSLTRLATMPLKGGGKKGTD